MLDNEELYGQKPGIGGRRNKGEDSDSDDEGRGIIGKGKDRRKK